MPLGGGHLARGVLAVALALPALALGEGCTPPVPYVVRGESFSSGNAAYDDFFQAVRQVRTEAAAAGNDEELAHAGLAKALSLDPAAKRTAVLDTSLARAKQLADKGLLLHLELTPEPHILTTRPNGKPDLAADEALLRAMEEAARTGLDNRKRFLAMAGRAADLEKRRVDLRAQALTDFASGPREVVVIELDAAQGVLAGAFEKAGNAASASTRFAVELAMALETGAEDVNAKPAKGKKPPPLQPVCPACPVCPGPVVATAPAAPAASPPPSPAQSPPAAAPPPKPAAAKPVAAPAPKPAAPPPAKKKPKGPGDDFEP